MSTQSVPAELLELRESIDHIDRQLVALLAERFALTHRVGEIKAREQLEAFDPGREEQKIASIRALCLEHKLNPELVAAILAQIMREVVHNHEQIRGKTPKASDR